MIRTANRTIFFFLMNFGFVICHESDCNHSKEIGIPLWSNGEPKYLTHYDIESPLSEPGGSVYRTLPDDLRLSSLSRFMSLSMGCD